MTDRNRSRRGNRTGVAGPGPFSERTDIQPVREMPASETGGYGSRQEMRNLQQGAPLPEANPQRPLVPGGSQVWSPGANPGRSSAAGLAPRQSVLPADTSAVVRAMFAVYPDPYLLRLIEDPPDGGQ